MYIFVSKNGYIYKYIKDSHPKGTNRHCPRVASLGVSKIYYPASRRLHSRKRENVPPWDKGKSSTQQMIF